MVGDGVFISTLAAAAAAFEWEKRCSERIFASFWCWGGFFMLEKVHYRPSLFWLYVNGVERLSTQHRIFSIFYSTLMLDFADWYPIKQRWKSSSGSICLFNIFTLIGPFHCEFEFYAHINLLLFTSFYDDVISFSTATFSSQLLSIECDSFERIMWEKKGNCCRMKFNFHHFDDVNEAEGGGWWTDGKWCV